MKDESSEARKTADKDVMPKFGPLIDAILAAYQNEGQDKPGGLTRAIKGPDDLRDFSAYLPRFLIDNFDKNLVLVEQVKQKAVNESITPAQLVIN